MARSAGVYARRSDQRGVVNDDAWPGVERLRWLPHLKGLEAAAAEYVREGLRSGDPRWEAMAQQLRDQISELKRRILEAE